MTNSPSESTAANSPVYFAPAAGFIGATDGTLIRLVARHRRIAITTDGQMVRVDTADADPSTRYFTDWSPIPIESLSADAMKAALSIAESLLSLPPNSLSAESLPAALKVAGSLCLLLLPV